MYSRLRTSLRAQKEGRRTSRKRGQRGGADWYKIPADRLALWNATPFAADFPLHFQREGAIEEPAPRMKEYYGILRRQDELFDTALSLIAKQLELPAAYTTDDIITKIDIIDGRRADMMLFINDAEQLINLNLDTDIDATEGSTKLQEIRGSTVEPLSTLLLYPKRLNNIFIQSLANIIITFKHDPTFLEQCSKSDALLRVGAVQLESTVRGNAYLQTAHDLRDGFFLNHGINTFNKEFSSEGGDFWYNFLKHIRDKRTITVENLFVFRPGSPCERDLHAPTTWAQIAAHIYLAHSLGLDTRGILALFNTPCDATPPPAERTYIPNAEYDTIDMDGVTHLALLSHMDDPTLQFILQVTHTVSANQDTG